MQRYGAILATLGAALCLAVPASAQLFTFSTGNPDGLIATASRPGLPQVVEIETGDDFLLTAPSTRIQSATFTGLLPIGAPLSDIAQVRVEIYRIFPKDSVNPPSGSVPTRTNSPSDLAFDARDTLTSNLTFTANVLSDNFVANNSVLNGINPKPGQTTGGEGAVRGQEVRFNATFTTPFDLPADHYFFVPQVDLITGDFFWLSAPKPIVAPGTPFTPDLQTWIRNGNLAPDWLRVGTDVVGAGTFNAAFSLTGTAVPEPGLLALLGSTVLSAGFCFRPRRRPR